RLYCGERGRLHPDGAACRRHSIRDALRTDVHHAGLAGGPDVRQLWIGFAALHWISDVMSRRRAKVSSCGFTFDAACSFVRSTTSSAFAAPVAIISSPELTARFTRSCSSTSRASRVSVKLPRAPAAPCAKAALYAAARLLDAAASMRRR